MSQFKPSQLIVPFQKKTNFLVWFEIFLNYFNFFFNFNKINSWNRKHLFFQNNQKKRKTKNIYN